MDQPQPKAEVTVQAQPAEQAGLPILVAVCPHCNVKFATWGEGLTYCHGCRAPLRFVDATK